MRNSIFLKSLSGTADNSCVRTHLHETLKRIYAGEEETEFPLGSYFIDGRRGGRLVEIQTRNLAKLRPKLECLLGAGHRLLVVYPVAAEKVIVRQARRNGPPLSSRRSPRRRLWTEAFDELVFLKGTLGHPGLAVHIVLTSEEEWRLPPRRWRREVITDRRLLKLLEVRVFEEPRHWLRVLPPGLPLPFQSHHLARALGEPRRRAQAMLYVLSASGSVQVVGRDRRGIRYVPFDRMDLPAAAAISTGCEESGSSPSSRA